MHCFRGDDLTLVALTRAAAVGERAFPRLCALLLARRNVGAPAWPAFDDGALPFVMDLVAKTAEPVFLIHALPKRRREGSQRVRGEPQFLQARPGERDGSCARVAAVCVGDG